MDDLILEYKKLKQKRDQADKEARDYIKENTKDARERAQKLSVSHIRLLKFLRSLDADQLKCLTESQNLVASGNTQQIISKLMGLFDHTSEDN
ncbi:MAG: hypothetical protein KC646_17410 [Candidatus Cloacimonetes bacterium]|nr:hypothetical protein [Candidatus Cloacimonadota bacterium]